MKIAEHPFLWGMKPEHIDIIGRGARERSFEPREVIFHQGEPASRIYLIEDGKIALEAHGPDGRHLDLQTLGPGEVLGWSWLFAPFVWTLQAHVLEPTRVTILDGAHLLVACEENHDFGYALMRRVAHLVVQRLETVSRQILFAPVRTEDLEETTSSSAWTDKPVSSAIAEHPFLLGFKKPHLDALTALAMQVKFAAEETIYRAGDPANRFYLIQRGRIALEAPSPSGRKLLHIVSNGEALGWSWLYEPYQWHFDARALEDTIAIFFYGTRLRELCEAEHDLGYEIMKRITQVVIRRLHATRQQLLAASKAG
jgi:CRP-like cAMP-binding protein